MYRAKSAVFLFMYLKKLYMQSKFWFVVIVLFAIGQLVLDYKDGIEVSPFYHYSMFSFPYHYTNTYECVEVSVNGKQLQTKDFTPNGWDNITMPIIQYTHQSGWNSAMYNQTINRVLPASDSTLYTNRLSQNAFDDWYHQRVLRLLKVADSTSTVQYNIVSYQPKNGVLVK